MRDNGQLKLDFGVLKQREMRDDHIGCQTLDNLTRGQYTESLAAVREYLANSLDAGASEIRILATGNTVIVTDNGSGMTDAQLDDARGIGLSDKDEEDIGFRGIGLYSGYNICDRIVVTSKAVGEIYPHQLELRIADMRQQMPAARKSRRSLRSFLEDHTRMAILDPEAINRSYTIVQLENVAAPDIGNLGNREALRTYLVRTLCLDFPEDFKHRKTINDFLQTHIPGYKPVTVVLESEVEEPLEVRRPVIPNLGEPKLEARPKSQFCAASRDFARSYLP